MITKIFKWTNVTNLYFPINPFIPEAILFTPTEDTTNVPLHILIRNGSSKAHVSKDNFL